MSRGELTRAFNMALQHDEKLDDKDRDMYFYTLEGYCPKCRAGPYSLVYTGFSANLRTPSQSILKVTCICCMTNRTIRSHEVTKDSDPPEEA